MPRCSILCSSTFLGLVLALPAVAAELAPASRITEVTVFPDRAEVVRTLAVEMEVGSHSLRLTGLPAGLLAESVRVDALSSGDLMVGAVETRPSFSADLAGPAEREIAAAIATLELKQRELVDRASAARVQLDFVGNIGKALPERAGDEIARGLPDPEVWRKSWTALAAGADEALAAIRGLDAERQRVEHELQARREELDRVRTGQRATMEAVIALEARSRGRAEVHLRYQVPGASWRPLYEARLDSDAGSVQLVQRAEVRQATGEDWTEVDLTLSTARPADASEMPRIEPWFIDVIQRAPRPAAAEALQSMRAAPKATADFAGAAPAPPVTADTVASEFAAQYAVPGPATVAADSSAKTFTLNQRQLDVELSVRATPRLAPEPFLYGEAVFPGPEPLLAGPVAIFRDGAFTGRADQAAVMPGDRMALPFGADDKVRVDYRLETGGRSTEGIFNKTRRMERRYRIEVTSRHAVDIPITVIDQIPVPQDERIEVELLGDTTPPTVRDPDGRRGVLEWTSGFGPGESRIILLAYAVSVPQDLFISGF
ncbi:MAG TPA: mucoidy inhibitor MuiA family protein [Geminicoccaceae bacterium]|nr:mucoidy inhibitor MuiA family protein [Geminicoccus sp.]HMU50574.1 mucoidy inhibitor MuiA family protein [Geminicoccaceae bacterium]